MSTTRTSDSTTGYGSDTPGHLNQGETNQVETKPSFKTTELIVYVAAVVGVLLASYLVGDVEGGRADYFLANEAWQYVTYLTIGYLISRGLAKSGSRHFDNDPRDSR